MADAATQNAAGTGGYLGYAPIDCDIHPAVPDTKVLLPYFNDYWRENLVSRGIDRMGLGLSSYPSNAPTTARPDWRMKGKKAGSDYETLKTQALDAFGVRYAICNVLHAAQVFHSEDMSAVFCTAVNDWLTKEWLDRDTRLRASILVPTENPEMAVEEIERRAGDKRFVQVLMFAQNEIPLGKRFYSVSRRKVRSGSFRPCALCSWSRALAGCRRSCGAPTRRGAACVLKCRG